MKTLTPYPTVVGDIDVTIEKVALDGRDLSYSMISRNEHVVALHEVERAEWEEARIDLRVSLPEREIGTGPWTDVSCVAVLTEAATNARLARPLRKRADGAWVGSVPVSRTLHRACASLMVSVVATVGRVAGRVIGTADPVWVIDLTARTPERKKQLNIVEIDFGNATEEWLARFKESPWLVETSGEMPTVYLNTGFEGLAALLNGAGSEMERGARGLVVSQIADEAWTAMFHAAVSDLEIDDDGTPQIPSGWRESVLRQMLPDVMPGVSLADALLEVHERRTDDQGWSELQTNIHHAAAKRARIPKHVRTAVRALDRVEDSDR
ncbi:hypothetical protein GTZ78_23250 [Streptomyces sp. SID8361]|uniref:hypothetical protein n=1 Tax=Streptomyces sp. MnatMP-M27 TaxID=1839768 RepID=UPI00081F1CF7|nr:hypothetical protein [Streptomyces sp. MnatMP-M27]MYU13526.1 hypothetical protein [Streptomyces sp. SID8361]SCG01027.1 hypothetical protein GA0115260_1061711 [Streptomyces sp. MnatMP-M27]